MTNRCERTRKAPSYPPGGRVSDGIPRGRGSIGSALQPLSTDSLECGHSYRIWGELMAVTRGQDRRGARVIWVAIHTNEGDNPPDLLPDRTAENLASWLDREIQAKRYKSYQLIRDDDSTVRHCPDELAAWCLRGGNSRSLNLCFTGWARWTRGDWLKHYGMMAGVAPEVAEWCRRHQVPIRHLTPAQVEAGERGIIGHGDYTLGTGDGTHTDPGIGFPWDVFLSLVANAGTPRGDDDMTPEQAKLLATIHHEVTLRLPTRSQYAGPNPWRDTVLGMALNAEGRAHEALIEQRALAARLPKMIEDAVRAVLAERPTP